MNRGEPARTLRRVASAQIPTRWGVFQTIGFERETSNGRNEAAVDLARLAGLQPAGVICEIVNDDGTMARVPDLIRFCRKHDLLMITVAELARYRFDCDYEEALLIDDGLFPVPGISAVPGAFAPAQAELNA